MTERIFYLDIAALVILVIALISQLTRRMTKGTANHLFLILVSVTLLSCRLVWQWGLLDAPACCFRLQS